MLLNNFIFSLNVVAPVFIVAAVGWLLRAKVLDPATVSKLNWIVFNCALPVMLFEDIATSDFLADFDGKLILFAVGATLVIFALSWFIGSRFIPASEAGSFIQGSFRGNYAIVGLPIIANILGGTIGQGALMTTFVVPLYNILAVVVLTLKAPKAASGEGLSRGAAVAKQVKSALIGIVKNPLIISIILGIPFSVFRITLPTVLSGSISSISGLATPLALLAIGATINFKQIKSKFRSAGIAALIKLVATPLIFVPLAVLFGFHGEALVVLYVMFSVPAAVSSYIMADALGNDGPLAANIVLLTLLGSLFTFTIGIFILKTCALI